MSITDLASTFPKDVASLPRFGTTGRPPSNKKATSFPRGPRALHLDSKPKRTGKWITIPPIGFVDPASHNSSEEWDVYQALFWHLAPDDDPTKPPFDGHGHFVYQKAETPSGVGIGQTRAPASSVTDFAIPEGGQFLVIRLQSELHVFNTFNALQQIQDLTIDIHLGGEVTDVIDVYSQSWLGDATGDAVMRVVAMALKHVEVSSPLGASTAQRVRRPR